MKIPLQFINGTLILPALIRSPSYRIGFKKLSFIIDTGSPKTFISEKDALIFQIPFNALKFKEHIKLGGSKYELLSGKNVKLCFKTEEEKLIDFNFSLTVSRTTKSTKEGILESRSCPSIIGTDFLAQNDLSLYFQPSKGVYYIEKEN